MAVPYNAGFCGFSIFLIESCRCDLQPFRCSFLRGFRGYMIKNIHLFLVHNNVIKGNGDSVFCLLKVQCLNVVIFNGCFDGWTEMREPEQLCQIFQYGNPGAGGGCRGGNIDQQYEAGENACK